LESQIRNLVINFGWDQINFIHKHFADNIRFWFSILSKLMECLLYLHFKQTFYNIKYNIWPFLLDHISSPILNFFNFWFNYRIHIYVIRLFSFKLHSSSISTQGASYLCWCSFTSFFVKFWSGMRLLVCCNFLTDWTTLNICSTSSNRSWNLWRCFGILSSNFRLDRVRCWL